MRQQRRSLQRRARHDMRERGCTCDPTIVVLDPRALDIQHKPGCPFGDELNVLNRLGFLPVMQAKPTRRCDR